MTAPLFPIRPSSIDENFLRTPDAEPTEDANWRAHAHRWLGELYEAKGDAPKAIEQYDHLLALWKNAEPELQPQVTEIKGRVAKLRTKVGWAGPAEEFESKGAAVGLPFLTLCDQYEW